MNNVNEFDVLIAKIIVGLNFDAKNRIIGVFSQDKNFNFNLIFKFSINQIYIGSQLDQKHLCNYLFTLQVTVYARWK